MPIRNAMTLGLAGAALGLVLLVVTASAQPRAGETPNRPWSIEDALPSDSKALRLAPEPANKPDAALGRIPLKSGPGSFGFETETQIKPDRLPDGRPVPGFETSARQNQSYLGLSLSVPTDAKTIIPMPVAPPWTKPD
jgi:hypothetical protein